MNTLRLRHKLLLLEATARQQLGQQEQGDSRVTQLSASLRCALAAIEVQERLHRAHAEGPARHAALRSPRLPPAVLLAASVHLELSELEAEAEETPRHRQAARALYEGLLQSQPGAGGGTRATRPRAAELRAAKEGLTLALAAH